MCEEKNLEKLNKLNKLNMLAMRALESVQLDLEGFSCTLAMLLQEKLQAPEEPVRPVLLRSFEAEEPLSWDGLAIPQLKVVVLNDKCNCLLHFVDTTNGDKLLVLKREELRNE